jgi:hypothetical protein
MAFTNDPWFKYGALAALGGASGFMLTKNSATKTQWIINMLAGATLAPLAAYGGAYLFREWTPITGTPPTMLENLIPLDNAPKVRGKIPEGLDPVKAKFYRGEKTFKTFAAMEVDQGAFKTSTWWVLA